MVLLLNYLPYLILLLGGYLAYKKRKWMVPILITTLMAVIVYMVATPHYLPKGEPRPMGELPAFEVKEAQLKNDLREIDEKVQADLEKKLDWEQKVEENKNDGT